MHQSDNNEYRFKNLWLAIFILLCLILAGYAFFILSDPFPITSREGAALAPVYLMHKGLNPFDLAYNPEYNNSYVFIQQYINLAGVNIGGMNLNTLRIEGHFFILASCLLIYFSCYKISGKRFTSLVFSLIMYASCLYLNTAEARADAYGLFFYTAAISSYLLFKNKSVKVLILVIASLLGFYTKLYFVAGLIIVGAYECMIFSVKRLLRFVFLSVFLSLLSYFIVERFIYPGYFHLVVKPFFLFGSTVKKDYLFSFQQLAVFLVLLLPLLTGVLFCGRKFLRSIPLVVILSKKKYDLINADVSTNGYLLFGLIASTAGTVLFLSTHIGNQVTYLFHLMLPWYLLYFVSLFKNIDLPVNRLNGLAIICLAFFVLFLRPWNYILKSKGDWNRIYSYIDKSEEILGTPAFADYIIKQDKPLFNSGHSEFVLATSDNFEGFKGYTTKDLVLFRGLDSSIINDTRNYYNKIKNEIVTKRFDLIILDNTATIQDHYADLIEKNYYKADSANVYLPHSRHQINVFVYLKKQ